MIKFSIPGYYQHQDIVFFFAHLQKEHPEVFFENRCIDSTYDLPAHLIWNGGRINHSLYMDPSDVWAMADAYHETGIKLRHTCTNCMLTPEHFSDTLCNNWIRYNENKQDSVIVHNEQLGEYIKQNYPGYHIIWSTTRSNNDIQAVNTMSQTDMVVLDYTRNHDDMFLASLQNPKNIEILIAEYCVPNCPHRYKHYESVSRHQLWMPREETDIAVCPRSRESGSNLTFYDTLSLPHGVTNEYIDRLYDVYGIENFKIAGRSAIGLLVVEAICYYLIKPEYRDLVRHDVLATLH